MANDWQKEMYGKVYKSAKTRASAQKAADTKKKREEATYNAVFSKQVQDFAAKNNLQYNDRLKNLANKYMSNHQREQEYNKLNQKHQEKIQSQFSKSGNTTKYPMHKADEFAQKDYQSMRKEMGYSQKSGPVSQAEYDSLKANYDQGSNDGSLQFLKNIKNGKGTTKSSPSSFDKTVDKGLHGLGNLINKISSNNLVKSATNEVKDLSHSKLAQGIYQLSGLRNKVAAPVLAMKGMDKVDQYGGASATRNVLADATDNKNQSVNQYLQDVKKGFTGERRATGEEIAKNVGIKSKYGAKLTGFGIEALADPTNLVGAGAYKVGSKALKGSLKGLEGLSKVAKIAEEVNAADKVKPLLLEAPKPGAKFENAKVIDNKPKTQVKDVIKAMNDLGIKDQPKSKPLTQKQYEQASKNIENAKWDMIKQGYENPRDKHTQADLEAMANKIPSRNPKLFDGKPQEYYAQRYNDLVKHVKEKYPNGLQNEEQIQEAWSHIAKPHEDFNVNTLVERAYDGNKKGVATTQYGQEIIPQMQHQAEADQRIKNIINTMKSWKATPEPLAIPDSATNIANRSANEIQNKLNMNNYNRMLELISKKGKTINDYSKSQLEEAFATGKLPKVNKVTPNAQIAGEVLHADPLPKGAKISKRREPNGVLGLMEKPNESQLVNQGQLDPTTAPLARVENVKPVSSTEKVSKDYKDIQNIKDINQLQVGTKSLYELSNRLPHKIGSGIKNALDTAKAAYVNFQQKETDDLYHTIVKGLGIKKGSKDSALVQDFGEKTLALNDLKSKGIDPETVPEEELKKLNLSILQQKRPNDWQKFVQADDFFRAKYDSFIDQVNKVRAELYPNNEEKIVPKRSDYYHHFNEMEGLEGFMNTLNSPTNIDPRLEGISAYTKPNSKFQGFMQKRGLGPYKSDAVGGFVKYLQAAAHSIHIDPVIPVVKNAAETVANATVDSKNANKLVEALNYQAQDLAGKTNPYDRLGNMVIGRKGMSAVSWVNNRIKSNMILGNMGSLIAQVGNVPLSIGVAKHHSVPAVIDTFNQIAKNIVKNDTSAPIYKSNFLKERFSDQLYSRFDDKLIQQPGNLLKWAMRTVDKGASQFIWNSMYRKGLAKKVNDPIKFADYEARKVIAGRGVGEMPLIQKAKTTQVIAPFTLEVANQWKVLGEMFDKKDAAGILTFMLASYGMNKAVEQIRGSGISFDPISAVLDGWNKGENWSDKVKKSTGSLAGEVVGNIPGGNTLTSTFGNKKIIGTNSTLQELFAERNPNRFGSGLTLTKPFENPAFIISPYGANQAQKSLKGLDAIKKQGVYKPNGELQYPINTGGLKNLQMGLYGPGATSEASAYYNNNARPLSEKQTQRVDSKVSNEERLKEYAAIMQERKLKKEHREKAKQK